ncbi:MAG: TIGR03118 family protein, partial [Parvularculaceae bacterium]|nr:TIGR03118 family protein [Parvularculaceae bacterium]
MNILQRRVAAPRATTVAVVLCSLATIGLPSADASYLQTNLVTDSQAFLASQGFAPAATEDRQLINPWGASFSPTGPFWISDQGAGVSTLYNGAGAKQALIVTTPQNAGPPAGPTGQVFNGANAFLLANSQRGVFFFANLDGSIAGWNPGAGTTAQVIVPASSTARPAAYTGLAIGAVGADNYLYAANRATGRIDVFNSTFAATTLAGNFTDPGANPSGLAPFNVQALNGRLYVTYSIPGAAPDEAAAGQGFVSVFNFDGTFVQRIVADGGQSTSPWGVAIAPSNFGELSGALLVANFHENLGFIRAYDPTTGAFRGTLTNLNGGDINIPYLWAILFGNGGNGGAADRLFFTAGIGDEQHGLFGSFAAVPAPQSALLFVSALLA